MKSILLYNSGGGLGDSIQLFSLIISLKNHFKETDIYYLSAHSNHFSGKLKEYKINLKPLELNIKYFGFRFWHFFLISKILKEKKIDKFDLIIDLQSKLRNSLILKRIPHKLFYSSTLNFFLCTKQNNYKYKDHLANLELFFNTKIKKEEFKLFNLSDEILNEAKRLLPNNNYIGLSLTQGNTYRKKSWPLENFIMVAKEIIKKNKIPVFFINENYLLINEIKKQLPESLFPELQTKLSCPALVTALSSRLSKAISIDNGVMHMMSLAKIPMIVLFGPTNSDKFAPKYDSIKILDSKILYKSKNINLITLKDVLNLI